ncbi:hypothetical protein HMPREF1544_02532 [Mucor circinelloides 1006PhL]|uniref:Uncharacterized protein n=1 Tax=Mucor circinelloides f. circinelloides (strain 1006PhL) TaxID=1220926 RepID=S2JQ27_MUCC1|nr:hypothetical protein HMPREF1544_02532 [Mucor circinelloides 1006PhL]
MRASSTAIIASGHSRANTPSSPYFVYKSMPLVRSSHYTSGQLLSWPEEFEITPVWLSIR